MGASGSVPAGKWTLSFERRWLETIYPGKFDPVKSATTHLGYMIDNDTSLADKSFFVAGSVTINPVTDADPRGGWWCQPSGPAATYMWTVSSNTLTLKPVNGADPNQQRGAIFTGEWTRTG